MPQGLKKLSSKPQKKTHSAANIKKLAKGARIIKPKKPELQESLKTKQTLTKAINKKIESELTTKAGANRFNIVKPQTQQKPKQATTMAKMVKHVMKSGKIPTE